jgi:hypothetical protein
MYGVVYNRCYGGFSVSDAAMRRMVELGSARAAAGLVVVRDGGWPWSDWPRHDPRLVRVVLELGDAASGDCANLGVYEVEDDEGYQIEEYDGKERVRTGGGEWIFPHNDPHPATET